MNAVHKHLVLRGYKCEDLFDTGRICQQTSSRLTRVPRSIPTGGLCETISGTLKKRKMKHPV